MYVVKSYGGDGSKVDEEYEDIESAFVEAEELIADKDIRRVEVYILLKECVKE